MTRHIVSTGALGIRQDSLPYRLYLKAKQHTWNPATIDLTLDRRDWETLTHEQKDELVFRMAMTMGAEEAMMRDIIPLLLTISKQGHLEEEMFLSMYVSDRAKHVEFFRLWLNAVGETGDLSHYYGPNYRRFFHEILPATMNRLLTDPSPEAIAEAAVVSMMFGEGVLAESTHHIFYKEHAPFGRMWGLLKAVEQMRRDKDRHVAYGTFLLQRLICADHHLLAVVNNKMDEMVAHIPALNIDASRGKERSPFGLPYVERREYSATQLKYRFDMLQRATHQTMEEIYKTSEHSLGVM